MDATDTPPWRLFVALPLPHEARLALDGQLAPYRQHFPNVRWSIPSTFHVTLLFLAGVDRMRIGELADLVARCAETEASFFARTGPAGGRVVGREGVAWLTLAEGATNTIRLADLLHRSCPEDLTAAGRPPRRTPQAHLTIARRVDPDVLGALRSAVRGPLGIAWQADRLTLVRSHLGREGARHEIVSESLLAGRVENRD